ncbi:MAG: hypothetical protein LBV54_01000 [Puniceicoccales bacterium]|nr:hypothetical protein [Puniceicoccales bacterium]
MEEFPPKAANSILEQPAANLESDVSVILRQLKSIGLTNDNYEVDLAKTKAQIFILAAQIYQHGDTALANKLAAQLLVRFPDKKELFTAAVSFLAREAYNQATDAVLKSGDWKEYAARLDYFLKNTPEEWWSAMTCNAC